MAGTPPVIACGIDPSLTSAGVAILQDGKPIHVAHHGFTGTKAMPWGARSRRIRYVCSHVIRDIPDNVDLVCIEAMPEHGRILPSTLDRAGLWHGLYGALDARKLPTAVVNPMTLKTWATGSGSADKAAMVTTVSDWWPDLNITCDDEADAIALGTAGAFHLGDPMPFEVKTRHTTGLEKVAWPVTA